jgi:GDPmannose 4,6-dehydratase
LYREAYGIWIANGILFNHESPRRGETFVTRKTSRAVARIALGVETKLTLGNLDAKRDWGYAPEYVEMMWKMTHQRDPDDFVVATGESHSVREFVDEAFARIGVSLRWSGRGNQMRAEVGDVLDSPYRKTMKVAKGDKVVSTSNLYLRPADPSILLGDSSRARRKLGWRPRVRFEELVRIMVEADIKQASLLLEGTRHHREEWREFVV